MRRHITGIPRSVSSQPLRQHTITPPARGVCTRQKCIRHDRRFPAATSDNRSIAGQCSTLTQIPRSAKPLRALAAPHPRQTSRMADTRDEPGAAEGDGGVACRLPPPGLPPGAPGASLASSTGGGQGDVFPGVPCGRAAPGRRDATHLPSLNQALGARTHSQSTPTTECLLTYINCYINGYRRPRTPSDLLSQALYWLLRPRYPLPPNHTSRRALPTRPHPRLRSVDGLALQPPPRTS
jgi:hypothetical protein